MKTFIFIVIGLLFVSLGFADDGKPVQEPEPEYQEDLEKKEAKLSKKEKMKKKKHRAPRKVFPPSKNVKKEANDELPMEEQIKAADQPDVE